MQNDVSSQFVTYERVSERCTTIHWKSLTKFAWGKLMSGKYYGRLIENENDLQSAIESIGDEYIKTNRIKFINEWDYEKELTQEVALGPKVFECPTCRTLWRVTPKHALDELYWDYEGKCEQCGDTWVRRYYARRKPLPGEKSTVIRPIRNQTADP